MELSLSLSPISNGHLGPKGAVRSLVSSFFSELLTIKSTSFNMNHMLVLLTPLNVEEKGESILPNNKGFFVKKPSPILSSHFATKLKLHDCLLLFLRS